MNLAIRYATPAAKLPTIAVCNAPFSLGTPVKWLFTKPNTTNASNVMAAETAICTIQDLIRVLAADNMTTVQLRESVVENTSMSQSKFYELSAELAPNQPEHADRPGQFAGGDITKAQSVKTAPLHL